MSHYSIYGLNLKTDVSFDSRLLPSQGVLGFKNEDFPPITYHIVNQPPHIIEWTSTEPVYSSPTILDDGQSLISTYRLPDFDIIRYANIVDYYIYKDRILAHPLDLNQPNMMENYFLGTVLAFYLERSGIPMLHASAVNLDGRIVAFLASSGGGKSSLASSFMQVGYALQTDDVLPVEQRDGRFWGRSGYPSLRLWPEEAEYFVGDYHSFKVVHPQIPKRRVPVGRDGFGTFCSDPQPVGAIYVPERRPPDTPGTNVDISPISPNQAIIELVRSTFTPRTVEAFSWQPRRLKIFSRLVQQVPIRQLSYPSGLQHLERVRQAVLADLSTISG